MDILKSWIYIDNTNNIWRFSINSANELQYSIMYKEEEWTKEKLIDQDVTGYYIYSDKEGIHIIYINTKAELKYCTFIDQQWMGKTIYKLNEKEVEMKDINLVLTENEMHIFCLIIDKESKDHGIIMHCKWKGMKTKVDKLYDLILTSKLKENYLVFLYEDKIEMVFFSDEGNEISLNHSSYIKGGWTKAIRLYGIFGEKMEFKMLKDRQGLHLINKYKENSVNYIIHVLVKKGGSLYKSKIHESMNELTEVILFKEQNTIVSYWLEENKIYSSFFEGKEWSSPACLIEDREHKIIKYNYIKYSESKNIRGEAYGIGDIEFKLLIPGKEEEKVEEQLYNKETEEKQETTNKEEVFLTDREINKNKIDLKKLRSENKSMEETITSLNAQLKRKQKIMDEYEDQLSKTINYKQKTEDNYNVFLEVQDKLQKELTEIKRLYEEEVANRKSIEIQFEESEKEKAYMKELIDKLNEDNDRLNEENKEMEAEKKKSFGKGFWKF